AFPQKAHHTASNCPPLSNTFVNYSLNRLDRKSTPLVRKPLRIIRTCGHGIGVEEGQQHLRQIILATRKYSLSGLMDSLDFLHQQERRALRQLGSYCINMLTGHD